MPKFILTLGRNIDWIAAIVVVVVWLLHDQGLVAIGDSGNPDAPMKISGQTLAAAGALVLVLRGAVEKKVRAVAAKALPALLFAATMLVPACASTPSARLDQAANTLEHTAKIASIVLRSQVAAIEGATRERIKFCRSLDLQTQEERQACYVPYGEIAQKAHVVAKAALAHEQDVAKLVETIRMMAALLAELERLKELEG